jgi:hypothetical protein
MVPKPQERAKDLLSSRFFAWGQPPLLKVNYYSTVVRMRSADQTPSVIAGSFGREKAFWLACHPPLKRASSDNEAGDACQLGASAVGVC